MVEMGHDGGSICSTVALHASFSWRSHLPLGYYLGQAGRVPGGRGRGLEACRIGGWSHGAGCVEVRCMASSVATGGEQRLKRSGKANKESRKRLGNAQVGIAKASWRVAGAGLSMMT